MSSAYRFTVVRGTREKAVEFRSVVNANGIRRRGPVSYADLEGWWVDVWRGTSGDRAEFGPYLSKAYAQQVGRAICDQCNA